MTISCTGTDNIEIAPNPDNLIVAAYVWPSCHDDQVAREWVEESYLLPDRKHGFGYLEAVRDVVTGKYDKYTL